MAYDALVQLRYIQLRLETDLFIFSILDALGKDALYDIL